MPSSPLSTPIVALDKIEELDFSRLAIQDPAPGSRHGSRWTRHEDSVLLSLVKKGGTQWDMLKHMLAGRSLDAMRSRYYRLTRTKSCSGAHVILVRSVASEPPGVVSLMTACAHQIALPKIEDCNEELREVLDGSTDFHVTHKNTNFWVKCRLCNDCDLDEASWLTIDLKTILADEHAWGSRTDRLLFAYAMEYLYDLIFFESRRDAPKPTSKFSLYGIVPEDLHQHVHISSCCSSAGYEVCSDVMTLHASLAAKVRFPVRLRVRADITIANIQHLTFLRGGENTKFPNGFVEVHGGTFSLTGYAELTLYHFSDYVVVRKKHELTSAQEQELMCYPSTAPKRYILGKIVNESSHLTRARICSVATNSKETAQWKAGCTLTLTAIFAKLSTPFPRLFGKERAFNDKSMPTGTMEPGEEQILVPHSGALVDFEVLLKGADVEFHYLYPPRVVHSLSELPDSLAWTEEEEAGSIAQQMEDNTQIMWTVKYCRKTPAKIHTFIQRLPRETMRFVRENESEFIQLLQKEIHYSENDWRYAKTVPLNANQTEARLRDEDCHEESAKVSD
mmetsp:Transcript_15995/g.40155  ORF Transcript_15995/g.40155 Transcript_15995/m.40155 type:complete len:563 (-) Transcript_15995:2687-4375(-)